MKRQRLLALVLSMMLMLSACGTPSSNTPPSNNTTDTPNATAPDNSTLAENMPSSSGDSITDAFLKTITAETAEAKGVCGADLTWYYQDNVLVIKGTGEMNDYEDAMPPWYDKDDEYGLHTQIHWLIVDEGTASIGRNAFRWGRALSKVQLPNTLQKIKQNAFGGCPLTDIVIPSSVVEIEDSAFWEANSERGLNSVTFMGDAPEGTEHVIRYAMVTNGTVYYSGSGFDELIAEFPDINWVKQ